MSISKEKFEEMKKERMSQTFTTSYGTPYKIIEYYSATNVVVQFCDFHGFKKKTTYNEAKKDGQPTPLTKRSMELVIGETIKASYLVESTNSGIL